VDLVPDDDGISGELRSLAVKLSRSVVFSVSLCGGSDLDSNGLRGCRFTVQCFLLQKGREIVERYLVCVN